MYYIIASHGEYAEACKKSCEMISGAAPQFTVVTFTEEMTKESVENAYRKILVEKGSEQCQAIITDIKGGTPYNAAITIRHEYPSVALVSGLCLGMLIALSIGDTLESAMEQSKEIITGEGVSAEKKTKKVAESAEPVENNGIVNFRLDERLIHGQVATFWTRTLGVTRIMIVDNDILSDEISKRALQAAVPSGIRLSVLSVASAARKLNKGAYTGQRVFLIVRKTETIHELLEAGIKVKEVNIGNMGVKDGRKQITKSIYCTKEEIKDILDIEKSGVQVYAQMVPNDDKKKFTSFINEVRRY
ncbi:PTS mannose/fructose/sorbose transporter subunit IIAB [Lacrimispora indolis]|uniref:PTS mannose/fructose/sorbose transporter subunit IIAB n=1 Tax=Lacrimispora indolis TaxID=69825 RepID=UPI000407331F|nr:MULTISPECIES: PTS mannose/fructose/sorbose transporter subunit IIAB [Lachnospiraceae]